MLEQLQEMTEAIKHPRSLDWNPVKFSFTEETADRPSRAAKSWWNSRRYQINRINEFVANQTRPAWLISVC